MIYGYARCSTNEKLQDINRQVRELKQQGATDETIYLEYESYVTDCTDMEDVLQMLIGTGGNPVTVHGCTGAALQNGKSAAVVWLIGTPEKGISFRLSSSSFTAEALLPIAESVQLQ